MDERCDRCGDLGEDRRTLWHACFYAMHELEVPFKQVQITGRVQQKKGEEVTRFGPLPLFHEPTLSEKPYDYRFYNLRVCKECRADWLGAIQKWFNEAPEASTPTGTGVFIRRNGATVEATPEEVEQLRAKFDN